MIGEHTLVTAIEVILGLGIGTILEVLTVVHLASSRTVRVLMKQILAFTRALAVFVLAPILTLRLGYELWSRVAITVFIIYFSVTYSFLKHERRYNILFFEGRIMITKKIKRRITRKGRGAIFSANDFSGIGSRASVNRALSRLAGQGVIRRLTWGLYDYPRKSVYFDYAPQSAEDLAKAIARKYNHVLQPCVSRAANQLRLSTQVPAKSVYLTNGPTRTRMIGGWNIQFQNASPKMLVGAGQKTGVVFQALRCLGKDRIDDGVIGTLAGVLDADDRVQLSRQSRQVHAWMQPVIQQIVNHT